jgi:cysteinyl-tRNA synthetase
MNDDFNTPVLIANLFEGVRIVNSAMDKKEELTPEDTELLRQMFGLFVHDILGLKEEKTEDHSEQIGGLMELILQIREEAREKKDWSTSDKIRKTLQNLKITVKDTKEGPTWKIDN